MDYFDMKNVFTIPILSIFGLIFNILSTVVFSLIIKNGQRDDMYKHLLLKSICEALGCFFSVFGAIYYYNGTSTNPFIMVVWYIWFRQYFSYALFMASTGFEIAATFNCAISIEKKFKWCEKKLFFWIWVISIFVLSFSVEIFPVFIFSVGDYSYIDQFNRTHHIYNVSRNPLILQFGKFGLAESIIKEIMFLLILLSLNIYILIKLVQIGRRKRRLTSNNQNRNRAEIRKIIMLIVLFLTFLLGRLPNIVYFVVNTEFDATLFWIKFKGYGEIVLYFSNSISFFVYFFFNKNFERLFFEIIHYRSLN
jgi:hypothetical protein